MCGRTALTASTRIWSSANTALLRDPARELASEEEAALQTCTRPRGGCGSSTRTSMGAKRLTAFYIYMAAKR